MGWVITMKERTVTDEIMTAAGFAALFAGPLCLFLYVYQYLYDYYYIYIGWNLTAIEIAVAVATAVSAAVFYRKWRNGFYTLSPLWNILMIFGLNMCLFCFNKTVVFNFVIAVFGSIYAVRRTREMKLKSGEVIADIHDTCKWHLVGMVISCIIYICSVMFNTSYIASIMSYFGFDSLFKAGTVILTLNLITCLGTLLLFRVIFMRIAAVMIKA